MPTSDASIQNALRHRLPVIAAMAWTALLSLGAGVEPSAAAEDVGRTYPFLRPLLDPGYLEVLVLRGLPLLGCLLLIHQVVARSRDRYAALVAALLFALHPLYGQLIDSAPLLPPALLLGMLALWLLDGTRTEAATWTTIAGGACAGLASGLEPVVGLLAIASWAAAAIVVRPATYRAVIAPVAGWLCVTVPLMLFRTWLSNADAPPLHALWSVLDRDPEVLPLVTYWHPLVLLALAALVYVVVRFPGMTQVRWPMPLALAVLSVGLWLVLHALHNSETQTYDPRGSINGFTTMAWIGLCLCAGVWASTSPRIAAMVVVLFAAWNAFALPAILLFDAVLVVVALSWLVGIGVLLATVWLLNRPAVVCVVLLVIASLPAGFPFMAAHTPIEAARLRGATLPQDDRPVRAVFVGAHCRWLAMALPGYSAAVDSELQLLRILDASEQAHYKTWVYHRGRLPLDDNPHGRRVSPYWRADPVARMKPTPVAFVLDASDVPMILMEHGLVLGGTTPLWTVPLSEPMQPCVDLERIGDTLYVLDRYGRVYRHGPGQELPGISTTSAVDLEIVLGGRGHYILEGGGVVHALGEAPDYGIHGRRNQQPWRIKSRDDGGGYVIFHRTRGAAVAGEMPIDEDRRDFGWEGDVGRDLVLQPRTGVPLVLDAAGGLHPLRGNERYAIPYWNPTQRGAIDVEFTSDGRAVMLDRDGVVYGLR